MLGNHFTHTIHIPGALAANLNARFTLPFPAALVHLSAGGSNANDATIAIGDADDPDGYLTATAVGDSNVPAQFDRDDFDGALLTDPGGQLPHFAAGDTVTITVDYDGSNGTAVADLTLALTFLEG